MNVGPNAATTAPAAAPRSNPAPDAGSGYQNAVEHDKRTLEIAAGMSGGYPVVGMSMSQLAQVLGQPYRINIDDYGRGPEEQRIYERGGRRYLVYTHGGRVRAVQNRTGYTTSPRSRSCPSDLDIRNMEVTASSITLSDRQREVYAKQLEKMRACR
jgi:hypothetical protein